MFKIFCLCSVGLILCAQVAVSAPYQGPVIDAHNHWNGSRDAAKVADLMKSNNIVAVVMMPRAYGSRTNESDLPTDDESTLSDLKAFPSLFYPTVGMQLPQLTSADWNTPSAYMLRLYESVEQKLASGAYYGIGEVIIRHYPYYNHPSVSEAGKHMDVQKSPDTAHFRKLAALAKKSDVPLIFHMEGEPPLVRDLSAVLRDYPETKFVWSHMCGRISAELLAQLLVKHENLTCDLAAMANVGPTGYGFSKGKDYPARFGWPRAFEWTYIIEEDGKFLPEFREIILKFPNRFLGVGMDNAHGALPSRAFRERLQRFRELLGGLPKDVAKRLACENAKLLWKLNVSCDS